MRRINLTIIAALTLALLFSASASAKTTYGEAIDGYDIAAFSGAPEVRPTEALLVFFRPSDQLDSVPLRIQSDGKNAGYVLGGTFIYAYALPGDVRFQSENARLNFFAGAGRVYYVGVDLRRGAVGLVTRLSVETELNALAALSRPGFGMVQDRRFFTPPTQVDRTAMRQNRK
jgi:hypothetical protein